MTCIPKTNNSFLTLSSTLSIMPSSRCNECPSCLEVIAWKEDNKKTDTKGKKSYDRKRKKLEMSKPCSNPSSSPKKQRATEVTQLHAAGRGGQIGGEFRSPPKQPAVREARPKCNFDEGQSFDSAAYDEYLKLVIQCTKTADTTKSADVKLESRTMLPKMRKLTDLQLREEIDYEEATRDISNILARWMNGHAAGTRVFIPDIEERDEIYAALKIFSCAEEESRTIRKEYLKLFGRDEGVDIYNKLLDVIGEQEKACLPLVNSCLRVYMDKLTEDMDLWDDLSPLSFDKWKAEELHNERKRVAADVKNERLGKTSYDLMMSVFGGGLNEMEEAECDAPNKSAVDSGKCFVQFVLDHYSLNTYISYLFSLLEAQKKRSKRKDPSSLKNGIGTCT